MKRRARLPSVSVSTPRLMHRIIGVPTRSYPPRVKLRSRTQEDEQRRMQKQIEDQDAFWKLRYRNRP